MKTLHVKKSMDSPLLSVVMVAALIFGIPFSLYVLFGKWALSPQRQIGAVMGLLTITVFALAQRKFEVSILALLIFSQFEISLLSLPLATPVRLQLFFSDILLVLLIVAGLERRESLRPDGVGWIVLLLLLWQLLAAFLGSAHLHRSLLFLMWQVKYWVLYLFLRRMPLSESFAGRARVAGFIILLVQGTLAIAQQMKGGTLGLFVFGEQDASRLFFVEGGLRVSGTLGGTNALAGYLAMLLVFGLPFLFQKRPVWHYAAYGCGFTALLFALSRAGWLSFFLGSALAIVGLSRAGVVRFSRIVIVGSLGLTMIAAGVLVYHARIANRFADRAARASAVGRLHQFGEAWSVIERFPLFGIGPGVSEYFGAWNQNERFIRKKLPGVRLSNQPHSSQLQYWIESGTPGMLLFMLLFLTFILTSLRRHRTSKDTPERTLLRIGASSAALAAIIHTSFGTEINNPQITMAMWILFALARNRSIENGSARTHAAPAAMPKDCGP